MGYVGFYDIQMMYHYILSAVLLFLALWVVGRDVWYDMMAPFISNIKVTEYEYSSSTVFLLPVRAVQVAHISPAQSSMLTTAIITAGFIEQHPRTHQNCRRYISVYRTGVLQHTATRWCN